MTISKTQAQGLIDELRPMIEDALKRHGMDAKFAWKYGAWFELKVSASPVTVGDNGVNTSSPEARYYTNFGFTATVREIGGGCVAVKAVKLTAPLGTIFVSRGVEYAFAGIAAKRRKYPICAVRVGGDGTETYFTEDAVKVINAAADAAVKV